jgi:hypothetical protein
MEMQDGMGPVSKENRSVCVCCDPDCCGGVCCGTDSGRSEAVGRGAAVHLSETGRMQEAARFTDADRLKEAVANLVTVVFGRAQTAACCAPATSARSCC